MLCFMVNYHSCLLYKVVSLSWAGTGSSLSLNPSTQHSAFAYGMIMAVLLLG